MIKLVTQFDDDKRKVSLASLAFTPCCSCCCCCCLVTPVAGASISARYFQSLAEKTFPDEPEKIKGARLFGFWQPIGFYMITIIAAFLFFSKPTNLSSHQLSNFTRGLLTAAVGISYLVFTTWAFKREFNAPGVIPRVIGVAVAIMVLFAAEFFGGAIFLASAGIVVYLVLAASIDIVFVLLAFGKLTGKDEQDELLAKDGQD